MSERKERLTDQEIGCLSIIDYTIADKGALSINEL